MSAGTEASFATSWALVSAVLGASLHVCTQSLQLDNHGWRILGLWNTALCLTFFAISRSCGVLLAAPQTFLVATAFLTGFFGSTSIHRLLFSPVRKFRGPWQAAVTSFYRVYLATRSGVRLAVEIDRLHRTYGDYVRTGPREISILDPAAIPVLYGARSRCRRGPWYDHNPETLEEDKQVHLLRDLAMHSWRRRALDRGFSSKAVTDYEPRVQDTVNSLLKALDERAGTSVNISEWVGFFAFDTMGRVAYSQDFGMLDRGEGTVEVDGRSTSISALHETTKVFGILGPVPWLIKMIIRTNLASELAAFQQWCHSTMKYKQETFNPTASSPTDMSSHLLAFHHSAQDPTKRQTQRAIQNESILFIIAGSDTTASAITNAIFYLTRDRTRYLKLRALLDALPDSTARSLASVRYLDHVINETLRLKPPACEGLTRETPEGGITIPASPASGTKRDVFIPGNTVVSVPTWSLHRDVRLWGADADAFRPERFEGVDLNAEITPFIPFTRGAHTCPGKALGYVEMRAVIAGVVMRFDLKFAEGQEESAFDEGCLDTFTLTNPGLRVVMRRREDF